ncbi:MAG TPA: phosphatase PAP2 family protein [Gaiellaceae bacterium]|nr:phosphatase PAP2 family protein [Gaiellaceae bacterium]
MTLGAADAWDQSATNALEDRFATLPTPVSAETVLVVGLAVGILVGGAIGMALLVARRGRYALFWAATASGVLLLDPLLKEVFRRPSVSGEGYSFPSGTAMLSMAALAAGLVLVRPGWLRAIVLATGGLLVIAVGLSLVYVQWHYPSDVLAGWCAAIVWVALVWSAIGAERRDDRPHPRAGPGLDE